MKTDCGWAWVLLVAVTSGIQAPLVIATEPSDELVHVVVEYPALGEPMDERDGFVLTRPRPHILELHDSSAPRLLRVLEFEDEVEHAVLGPDARWCIVSHGTHLVRVDLFLGSQTTIAVIAANRGGGYRPARLAIDPEARRLAVLGAMTAVLPIKGDDPPSWRETALGVWDLTQSKWIAFARTPVWTWLAMPVWDGDRVLVEGPDERVLARRIGGHRWLTTLDLETGAGETLQGPLNETWDGQWMSDITAANAKAGEEMAERVVRMRDQYHGAARQARTPADVTMSSAESRAGEFVAVMHQRRGATWRLRIGLDGSITCDNNGVPQRLESAPQAIDGRILTVRVHYREREPVNGRIPVQKYYREREMIDLVEDEALTPLPPLYSTNYDEQPVSWYLPHGWIESDREQWSYYSPGHSGPRWSVPRVQAERWLLATIARLRNPIGSADGRFVALSPNPNEPFVQVRRAEDGAVLMTLPITSSVAAFDHSGERFVLAHGRELHIYAVGSGELLGRGRLPDELSIGRLFGMARDWWLVSDLSRSWVLNDEFEVIVTLPFGGVLNAEMIERADTPRLLLVRELGDVYVVNAQTGQVENRWQPVLRVDSPHPRPPQAVIAFNGRVLARNTGHTGTLELVRLSDLEPLLRVQVVPIGEDGLGWIAWTPNGTWDASPGAEAFVQLVRGITPAPQAQVELQRDGVLVRKQLRSLQANE